MPGPYKFAGYETTGYQDYKDTATGHMLVADPGGSYDMQAIDLQQAVPPPDGRWTVTEQASAPLPWEPPPSPPPVPEVPEVPSVPEADGSETE